MNSNLLTGSIVIHYDQNLAFSSEYIDILRVVGIAPKIFGFPLSYCHKDISPTVAEKYGVHLIGVFLILLKMIL